jgi:hypothetical protein
LEFSELFSRPQASGSYPPTLVNEEFLSEHQPY